MSIDFRSFGFFVGSLAPLLLVVFFDDAIRSVVGPIVWLLLLVAAVVCFFMCSARYIGRLDEAAWLAQKHAWFWGGGLALGGGIVALPLLAGPFLSLLPPESEAQPFAILFAGAFYIAVCQAIGFIIAWIVWWARRT